MGGKHKSATITALLVGMMMILALPIAAAGPVQGPGGHSKVDGTLLMLLAASRDLAAQGQIRADTEMGQVLAQTARTGMVPVYMVLAQPLDADQVTALERDGVVLHRLDGEIIHVGRVYSAEVPVDRIGAIAADPSVELIESAWKPGLTPPLDLTVSEIHADQVWAIQDSLGRSMTGHGIVIADLDTGVDVFHPALFKADGGTFDWIDDNASGGFEAGLDYVDLNGNGSADADEVLRFIDATRHGADWPIALPDTNDGVFRATVDWLYNDADNDSQRDFGTAAGFVEASPTFGEQLFIVDDANGNDLLDVGETLIALSTSKVLATRDAANATHTRGVDLIQSQDDTNGHGTSVSGVLAANTYDRQKYVGVSPDAELLVADIYGGNYLNSIAWAQAQGADIILHEVGSWVQQYMDGSSAVEQAIDAAAAAGIVQVVPAGNLAGYGKHAQTEIADGDTEDFPLNVTAGRTTVWITVLWRDTGNNLDFALTQPGGGAATDLPDTGAGSVAVGTNTAMYARANSSRGTARYDIQLSGGTAVAAGSWTLQIGNSDGADEAVHAFAQVINGGWSGGTNWTAFTTDESTMTWPSTADDAITVANYHPPGRAWPAGYTGGDLRASSGRGPRVDGARTVDIAAPGNWAISIASKDQGGGPMVLGKYRWFSGTSCAGPHVAGAAALMLQHHPGWNHATVRQQMEDTARSDGFTGATPNDDWGHGKLDAYAAADPTGIAVDDDPAIANEGDTAENTGTYTVRTGGTVTLGASLGTITDQGGGLWSWSFDTTDGPDESQTVTVTVTDDEGNVAQATFELQVDNVAPSLALNSDAPEDEGSPVTVSGVVTDPGWLDPLSAVIDWDDGSPVEPVGGVLENLQPDATLTFDLSHVYGDNGDYDVEVCASDDVTTACETLVLQIDNVPPDVQVDPGQVTEIDEGEGIDLLATFSDPGWLDTYTSSIDWGVGAPEAGTLVVTVDGPPEDQGEVSGSHLYGDNGAFSVTVTVTDDDGGAGSDSFTLTVHNVDPTAEIAMAGATRVNGIPTFLGQAGDPLAFSGRSQDPGSDDLTFSWDWDDGAPSPDVSTLYLVNPPDPDPFPSPSVQPRDVTDTQPHAFADACLYEISLRVEDDDGGHSQDQAHVIVTGNAAKPRPEGYWQHQYRGNGSIDYDRATLRCYLAITGYASKVFNEKRDASTLRKALDVLFLSKNGGSVTEQFDRELLTVWLNFANGALEYSDIVAKVKAAERVRLNPNAKDKDIREQTKILHQLNH